MHAVVEEMLEAPDDPRHDRALRDVGALVGEALVGPVAMLNPARVVLTGSLAVSGVKEEIADRLDTEHRFGEQPKIITLPEPVNRYIRAQGAALAVLRERVYRALPKILSDNRRATTRAVRELTVHLNRDSIERMFPAEPTDGS
jgi:predicted NBD/HSP70 family sugar kinase